MNARVVLRKLRRNSSHTFWGYRAFVTLRIPLTVIGEPFPRYPMPDGWQPFGDDREWTLQGDGDDAQVMTVCRTSWPASTENLDQLARGARGTIVGDAPDGDLASTIVDDGSDGDWVSTIQATVRAGKVVRDEFGLRVSTRPEDGEFTAADDGYAWLSDVERAEIAASNWRRRHVDGGIGGELGERIDACDRWSKTRYPEVTDRHLNITYSVKAAYRDRTLRFAAAFARLHRYYVRRGIDVRVTRFGDHNA